MTVTFLIFFFKANLSALTLFLGCKIANDHRSQLIGSRFFCHNSPAAAAREVFKPSTDAESLLGSIKKNFF